MKSQKIWMDGKFIDWDKAKIHILTHSLHYGSGVFEGLRFYDTAKGPAIFRLNEHLDRLFFSASCVGMKPKFSKQQLAKIIIDLIRINKINSGYIRPLFYYGEKIGLNPAAAQIHAAIIAIPWGKYLSADSVKAKISDFIRIHPRSTISTAKITGTYYNSVLASLEVHKKGFEEAILLDFKGNLAEGPGENVFIVKKNVLITPKQGNILPGITRDSILKIAKDLKITTVQKTVSKKMLLNADEAFYTGTAAEVTPIRSINSKKIGKQNVGPLTAKIKDMFVKAIHGEIPKHEKWLTVVK